MDTTISQTRDDRIRDFRFEVDQLIIELVKLRRPELQRPDGSWPDRMMGIEDTETTFRGASLLDS